MNKTNDFKYNLPAYSDPVDIEDLNDNFRGIDDALMAGLCKKDYTGNNMGSSDPSARKYAWAPWLEIVNDNEFDVVVTDRNAPAGSEEATINIAAGQTFRKYINGRYYMNFYVQDQHDVTFKWFVNAETYINESGGGGGGTGTVTSVSVQGGSGSHLTGSGNPIETSGTITINVDEGYSIPSDDEQTAWDGKAADLKFEINSSTFVITAQLKDSSGNLIGNERTIDLPLETMVVDGEYDPQTQKIKLELKNGNYVEFSVADLVSGLQTELSASNKLDPAYIDYDSSHRAVSDTEKDTWSGKQNAISDLETIRSGATAGATAVQPSAMQTALAGKQDSLDNTQLAAVNSGINSTKVGQISTNQTNILYALGKTGHNLLEVTATSGTVSGVAYTVNKNEITISSNGSNTTSTFVLNSGSPLFKASNNVFAIDKVMPAGATITVKYTDGTIVGFNSNNQNTNTTLNNAKDVESIYLYIDANKTISDTIKVMVCTQDDWEVTHEITPYQGIPNYDLTRLEAEDRAELVELVDNGAKNLLAPNYDSETGHREATWTRSTSYVGATVTGTVGTTWDDYYLWNGSRDFSDKEYVLVVETSNDNLCFFSSNNTLTGDDIPANGQYTKGVYRFKGVLSNSCRLTAKSGTYSNATIKVMICTKAAFCISPKFVPYRLPYDTLGRLKWKSYEVDLKSVTFTKSAGGAFYYSFSVSSDFSNILAASLNSFSYIPNKGYTIIMNQSNSSVGVMVYDATNPQALTFDNGQLWILVLGFS